MRVIFSKEPLVHGGGAKTSTNAIIVTTLGDMNVPASSGVHAARAAGFVEYKTPVPDGKYDGTPYEGLPANQILIDTYVAEAVNTVGRFFNGDKPVHLDVENFSEGSGPLGTASPVWILQSGSFNQPLASKRAKVSWAIFYGGS